MTLAPSAGIMRRRWRADQDTLPDRPRSCGATTSRGWSRPPGRWPPSPIACAPRAATRTTSGSVERALRRLRTRGTRDGGAWGARALALFGLPDAIDRRVRWLGQYHSRFTDLPRPLCVDLLRAWARPPLTESRVGRAWLALAEASLALRDADHDAALAALDRGRGDLAIAPPEAQLEAILARAYVASRRDPTRSRRCSPTRPRGSPPSPTPRIARAWPRASPITAPTSSTAPAITRRPWPATRRCRSRACRSRARRASGVAYAASAAGRSRAITAADQAAAHAGDGGHVRARAMALALAARITGDDARHQRALAISRQLADETLLARLGAA